MSRTSSPPPAPVARGGGLVGWLAVQSLVLAVFSLSAWAALAQPAAETLYREHCAACHGPERLGAMAPALLPENLERLRKAEAMKVIREGRLATQMPPFIAKLSAGEIARLADWIYTPVTPRPDWDEAHIRASRIVHHAPGTLADGPQFAADLMNLFLLVEAGDHHVSVIDGDRMERIHRFPSRYALHGGPKFTPDGRYVFFASRDGWVSKFDLWNLKTVVEVRAGINTRNLAVSADGRYVAVANYLPHTLVLLDAELQLLRVHAVRDREGTLSSRVSAVYDAPPRRSFVAALKDVPEVWEISYDPRVEDIPAGVIHDFKFKEGAFIPGFLNPRRTALASVLDDFFFTQDYSELMGASREAGKGQVVNLDVRRKVADLDLPGMPHLGSGITWERDGRSLMATPNLREALVSVIDMKTWQVVREIPTAGPGFFLRSHANTPYAWVDGMMGARRDTLVVLDKTTLEKVAELTPEPGRTLAHVEFDRYGRHALASLWEKDGAVIVYDARTLKEVKRIPANKPVGKYNLYNKIHRDSGTSH